MPDQQRFFITGNELQRSASMFIENLFYLKSQKMEKPLFIEMNQSLTFSSKRRERLKEKTLLHFDYYPDIAMTRIPLEKLRKESRNAKKDALFSDEQGFSSILFYSELNQDALAVLPHVDFIIFIMRNDSYSAGFLYNSLNFLKTNGINVRTGVVVSGVRFIEDAAAYFLKLKDEAGKLLGEPCDCDFLGFYSIDIPRLSHAQKLSQPLIRAFPECGFHGMIKYIDTQLQGLDVAVREGSLFLSLNS